MLKLKHRLMLGTISLIPYLNGAVFADSWTISQDIVANQRNTSLEQIGGTSESTQTLNQINFDTQSLTSGSTQTFTAGEKDLTLIQEGGTINSTQAINHTKASDINGLTQKVVFSGSGLAEALRLHQGVNSTIGNGNIQAVNVTEASTDGIITKLEQTVTHTNLAVELNQHGANNTQSINLIKASQLATTDGAIKQTVTVKEAYLEQRNTQGSLQTINSLIVEAATDGSSGGALTQTFTGKIAQFEQNGTQDSTQAINHVSN